ncbi:hypothetical protein O3P69_003217 [Scylla paramamosain]|uniref:Protein zwilch n=2 Tax=Scylla paramamosain TaxID=85552 RepID=A0AAW0UJP6_SCYPA
MHDKDEIRGALLRLLQGKTDGGEVMTVGEDQIIISREACPAVLLSANKNLPEILLVQKFTQHKKGSSSSITSSVSCSTPVAVRNGHASSTNGVSNDDLDVTGSPLKCPFMQAKMEPNDAPFTIVLDFCGNKKKGKINLTYIPIPSTRVGLIASKLNLTLSKLQDVDEFVPLWLVCDGKDVQKTLFMGIHRTKDTHARILITSGGPYYSMEDLPSLNHLMEQHTATGPTKRVDSSVEATYSVLASEDEIRSSSLSLTCCWKQPLTLLSSPAPDAQAIANVHVVCGDPRSPVHQMYLELSVLRGFVKGLKTGEVSWYVRENSNTVAEELEEVFTSIRDKGVRTKREEDGGCDFDMMIEGKFLNWRQNMDFTDRLWSILMRCESYQELKDSLNLVFKAVAGEEVRPQIHVRNTTQVGSVVRNLIRGRGSLPQLRDLTPLLMLIEIGYEKLKRDYINIFQAGDLVTGEQLLWFIEDRSSNNEDMVSAVDQLERLHVALQAVVALRTYLSLPWASMAHFTDQVLNQMKEEELSGAHSFSLKLDALSVHQQFDSMKEDTWEVSLHSQEGMYSKLLVCHISHRPFISLSLTAADFEDLQGGELKEEDEDDGDDKYFCAFISSITDKLLQY